MPYTTLIPPADLRPHLADPGWVVVDCQYVLADHDSGRRDYQQAHIPGASYAHLKDDLADPPIPSQTGRHPLPDPATLTARLGAWGIGAGVQVVAYDATGGALAAARLWWLLHWLGHEAVAVLDGGWPAWRAAGYPTAAGDEAPHPPRLFTPHVQPGWVLSTAEVDAIRTDPHYRLIDVRAADRFRGANETIDPVAGHIPGAVSAPYAANLDPAGHFLPPAALRAHYQALLGAVPPNQAVFYCGSGVTSAHSLLALAHAGLGPARLYAGSWSNWIADPTRPIATGDK